MTRNRRLPVSVAAGSAASAEVGVEILRRGGSAADAAVAMVLAACAAETVFTGLGGGGFATHYEAATGRTRCLDFFVAVPGLDGRVAGRPEEVLIDFGGQVVPYAVGPGTVAVPGVPAGAAGMHERWGKLDWADLVQPAMTLASAGVPCGVQQAKVLTTVADAMLVGDGTAAYAPGGVLLNGESTLFHPGLAHAFEVLRDEGAAAFYTGRVADAMLSALGDHGGVSDVDLVAYEPIESSPQEAVLGGCLVQARGDDLDDLLGVLTGLDLTGDDADTARRLVQRLRARPRRGDTTSAAAADSDGNACAVTTSLGLSSGVWLSGYGIHLNSMMGEGELLRGELTAGERMCSMMTPLVMHDDDGVCLVAGAAGGSRIRSALAQVLTRVVRSSMPVAEAIAAPRLNPVPGKVHLEPGFPETVVEALAVDDAVVRWPDIDSYFGGVAAIDRHGPGADPRRGGDVRRVESRVS
ncbi:MAG: gamma-glutamyltransferase [Nocardioidaceae bacterium]